MELENAGVANRNPKFPIPRYVEVMKGKKGKARMEDEMRIHTD